MKRQIAHIVLGLPAILCLFLGTGNTLSAQRVGIAYALQDWDQENLSYLHAATVRLSWPGGVEFGAAIGVDRWNETGTACGIFIVEPCPEEQLDLTAWSFAGFVGYRIDVFASKEHAFSLSPNVGLGGVDFQKTGRSSGRSFDDPLVVALIGGVGRYQRTISWMGGARLFVDYTVAHGKDLEEGCDDCHNALRGPVLHQAFGFGFWF